jgi:hypothetical protein
MFYKDIDRGHWTFDSLQPLLSWARLGWLLLLFLLLLILETFIFKWRYHFQHHIDMKFIPSIFKCTLVEISYWYNHLKQSLSSLGSYKDFKAISFLLHTYQTQLFKQLQFYYLSTSHQSIKHISNKIQSTYTQANNYIANPQVFHVTALRRVWLKTVHLLLNKYLLIPLHLSKLKSLSYAISLLLPYSLHSQHGASQLPEV